MNSLRMTEWIYFDTSVGVDGAAKTGLHGDDPVRASMIVTLYAAHVYDHRQI